MAIIAAKVHRIGINDVSAGVIMVDSPLKGKWMLAHCMRSSLAFYCVCICNVRASHPDVICEAGYDLSLQSGSRCGHTAYVWLAGSTRRRQLI